MDSIELDGIPEPWNEPRQKLPPTFIQNANIDVVRASVVRSQKSMSGDRIYGYVEPEFCDIDTEIELREAERQLKSGSNSDVAPPPISMGSKRTFCFDIDGVIASIAPDNDYRKSSPITDTVRLINRLFENGHRIVLFTARGSMTGIDWEPTTAMQMREWGVPYHELRFGKPAADFYIDDRMACLDDVSRMID